MSDMVDEEGRQEAQRGAGAGHTQGSSILYDSERCCEACTDGYQQYQPSTVAENIVEVSIELIGLKKKIQRGIAIEDLY